MDSWYIKFFGVLAAITLMPLALLFLVLSRQEALCGSLTLALVDGGGQILAGQTTIRSFTDAPHRFIISQQLHKANSSEPLQPRGIYCFVRDPFLLSGLVQIWLTPFMTSNLLLILTPDLSIPLFGVAALGEEAAVPVRKRLRGLPEKDAQDYPLEGRRSSEDRNRGSKKLVIQEL